MARRTDSHAPPDPSACLSLLALPLLVLPLLAAAKPHVTHVHEQAATGSGCRNIHEHCAGSTTTLSLCVKHMCTKQQTRAPAAMGTQSPQHMLVLTPCTQCTQCTPCTPCTPCRGNAHPTHGSSGHAAGPSAVTEAASGSLTEDRGVHVGGRAPGSGATCMETMRRARTRQRSHGQRRNEGSRVLWKHRSLVIGLVDAGDELAEELVGSNACRGAVSCFGGNQRACFRRNGRAHSQQRFCRRARACTVMTAHMLMSLPPACVRHCLHSCAVLTRVIEAPQLPHPQVNTAPQA
jgi:hypothetical protein